MNLSSAILVACLFAPEAPPSIEVELVNERRIAVLAAERHGEQWLLRFERGSMTIPASLVARVGSSSPPGRGARAEERIEPRAIGEPATLRTFVVDDVMLEAALPTEYSPTDAAGEEKIAAFVGAGGQVSVRFAWSERNDSLWSLGTAIKEHHRAIYAGYRTVSERFTMLGAHPAWLLTFSYRKGERTWLECQGFLLEDRRVLIVSVSALEGSPVRPEFLVRSVGATLRAKETDG